MNVNGAETTSNALGTSYRTEDIPTLESAGESLSRAGDLENAVKVWALALRIRFAFGMGATDEP